MTGTGECRVDVSGIGRGDVIAEPGAQVVVSGIVSGQVRARGDAVVDATGMVG